MKPTSAPNRLLQVPRTLCSSGGFRLSNVLFAKGKSEKIIGGDCVGSQAQTYLQTKTTYFLVRPLIVRHILPTPDAAAEAER